MSHEFVWDLVGFVVLDCQQEADYAHLSRKCFWVLLDSITLLNSTSSTFPFKSAILLSMPSRLVAEVTLLAVSKCSGNALESSWKLASLMPRMPILDSSAKGALWDIEPWSLATLLDKSGSIDRLSTRPLVEMPAWRSKALRAALSLLGDFSTEKSEDPQPGLSSKEALLLL